jgi:hypothetical protein
MSTTSEIVRFLEEEVFTRQGYPGVISVRRRRNAAMGISPSLLLYGRDLAYPGAWDASGDDELLAPASERIVKAQRHQKRYIHRRL